MGLISRLKRIFSTHDRQSSEAHNRKNKYPTYDQDFIHNITWMCRNCENEIYWMEEDDQFVCHICNTEYSIMDNEFPELLRAKCWNCGEISDNIRGKRWKNFTYNCPNCEFRWKSHKW